MKPKKTTAPSDSHTSTPLSVALSDNRMGQRDSQDWIQRFDELFVDDQGFWSDNNIYRDGGRIHIGRVKTFIQQEKDKSYQAGFQEAVELATNKLFEMPTESMLSRQEVLSFLKSLKPTPDQGSEGEEEK